MNHFACSNPGLETCSHRMSETQNKVGWLRKWSVRGLRLILLGVIFGFFYSWASPRFYPADGPSGFYHGMLHGALMPMALPSLLMNQDVAIYADRNTGRTYKLGYICGINICGFVFFGLAFARAGRKNEKQPSAVPT